MIQPSRGFAQVAGGLNWLWGGLEVPPACGPVKPLHILLMTMFIDLAGFAMFIPLLNYIVAELGGTILTVGLLITAFSLAQFLCLPAWGRLSDRIGRRPVIMLGLGGAAVVAMYRKASFA